MKILNNIGPTTDPCTTPNGTKWTCDKLEPRVTKYILSLKKSANHETSELSRPKINNFRHKIMWSTLLKALEKSNIIKSAATPTLSISAKAESHETKLNIADRPATNPC